MNGGVLFLDEITEMPLAAQQMLLRALDTRTFTRLGGNESLTADFQVIAATNRNIGESILKQEFRYDIFHRLMGMMFDVPPRAGSARRYRTFSGCFYFRIQPETWRRCYKDYASSTHSPSYLYQSALSNFMPRTGDRQRNPRTLNVYKERCAIR